MTDLDIILVAWLAIVVLLLLLTLTVLALLNERSRRKAAEDLSVKVLDAMVAGRNVRIERGRA